MTTILPKKMTISHKNNANRHDTYLLLITVLDALNRLHKKTIIIYK